MALKIILYKFLILYVYTGVGSSMLIEVQKAESIAVPWIVVLIVMIFAPEITIGLFKNFRNWIKEGLEDADGKFNKSDIKDMAILYGSLWSLRIFIFFSWATVFHEPIPYGIYITPLIGSFGTAGLTVIKSVRG